MLASTSTGAGGAACRGCLWVGGLPGDTMGGIGGRGTGTYIY